MAWSGLSRHGAPRLITHFDKGHLELPRLLHVLALAYLLSVWPSFRARAGAPVFWPLAVNGGGRRWRCFALGTILSFAARALRELWTLGGNLPSVAFDGMVILTGLCLQLGFAALRDGSKRTRGADPGHPRRGRRGTGPRARPPLSVASGPSGQEELEGDGGEYR